MTSDGFVSVIMPVLDGERFVAEAVASVRAQGWPELELIAVDDGSTDGTPVILEALAADPANRMQVVRIENRGPAAARNHALGLARGSFIAFIDADDLWPDGKLAAQMRRFVKRPELEAVYGLVEIRDCEGFESPLRRHPGLALPTVLSTLGCAVFRAGIFPRVGRLDETLRFGEDTDLMLRLIEAEVPISILNRTTLIYRQHDRNMTLDYARGALGTITAIKRSLARRRAGRAVARPLPQLNEFLEQDGPE